MAVRVTSEIGALRKVVVHRPGTELLAVTPTNRTEYLYDDIIDLHDARVEHEKFVSVLKAFAEVLEVEVLLKETLENPDAREFLITRSEEVTADKSLREVLGGLSTDDLMRRYVEGWSPGAGPFSKAVQRQNFVLPPVPNLYFTRDAAMVLGTDVIIAAMHFASRWPEEALMRTIVGFHPAFSQGDAMANVLYDGSDERRHGYSMEGGDLHPLREDLVLVGLSERTSAACLDILSERLFANGRVRDVLAVILPAPSCAIHLDMAFTQLDRELCAVYPPMFSGPMRCPILHRTRGNHTVREPSDLFTALKDVDMSMEPIFCGGTRTEIQEREQWASGCNFLAVAPGQVLAYRRNEETLRAMENAGFRLVEAEWFQAGKSPVRPGDKCVVTVAGGELVRGGGGPRCMTCPILRDEVW